MQVLRLVATGVENLDDVLGGGIPAYSLNIIAGQPGTGKTILAQQILFNHIRNNSTAKAFYLTTLSEPTVKVLRYMRKFTFFDADALGERVLYHDIGNLIRENSLPEVADHIMGLVEEHRPEILIIDSFKAIHDLVDAAAFRRFCHDLSVVLVGERCTTFLVGEYDRSHISDCAEFAIADGIFLLDISPQEGEQRRSLQVLKLRGCPVETAPFPFVITDHGVSVLSLAVTLRGMETGPGVEDERLATGIPGLDVMLHGGVMRGRSILITGVSGTGRTTFALQFLNHGAGLGEKGLFFSFKETPDRLRRMAQGFGWNLHEYEDRGLIRIIFVPQTEIRLEEHLEQIVKEVENFRPHRFSIDSFSAFLHRIKDQSVKRDKIYQLATLMQYANAVGMFILNVPAEDLHQLSHFSVEETVMDGTIVMSSEMVGLKRRRYLEVYKMRGADHVPGRHRMEITEQGVEVLYIAPIDDQEEALTPLLIFTPLQRVTPDGIRYGANWLVEGEQGTGKSTLSYQFALEGLKNGEAVLFLTTDVPAYQVRFALEAMAASLTPPLNTDSMRILDSYPANGKIHLDLTDTEGFLYQLIRHLKTMPRPCRLITDSLTTLASHNTPERFLAFVERKNRLLHRPDVVIFDTFLLGTLDDVFHSGLRNNYDLVLRLYSPDWGEMSQNERVSRVLQVFKNRTAKVDSRPYPYTIRTGEGLVVQSCFYG
jgi:circadian clock protein KaiC